MNFSRADLVGSVDALVRSPDVYERCVGLNYVFEENVSPRRLSEVEQFDPAVSDARELIDAYFRESIQGLTRGHRPSTFDEVLNIDALLSADIEENQKVIRLERIDTLLSRGGLNFVDVKNALTSGDGSRVSELTDLFESFPGERPFFAAFKSEVEQDLLHSDWLQRVIDRMGLLHHYPFDRRDRYSFALMEYTAKEVLDQARSRAIQRSFAIATVLECQNNPAFFPVPHGTNHGFTVDLRERTPSPPSVREILHVRIAYDWRHVRRLEQWTGADTPDLEAARDRHVAALRRETGRVDFGEVPS